MRPSKQRTWILKPQILASAPLAYDVDDLIANAPWLSDAEVLREILTVLCDTCEGDGNGHDRIAVCHDCGGRGWLPADGVSMIRNMSDQIVHSLVVPLSKLEDQ